MVYSSQCLIPKRYGKIFSTHKQNWADLNHLKGAALSYLRVQKDGATSRVTIPVRCGQQIVNLFEDLLSDKLRVRRGILIKGNMLPDCVHYLYLHEDSICVSQVKPLGGWIKESGAD